MVTPFTPEGALDEPSVRRIVDYLIAGGVDGIFVLGTNGELSSMPADMRRRLVELTVGHVERRVPVYAGITDNCLGNTLKAAEEYASLGTDVLVAHLPSYYPLGVDEIRRWFLRLAEHSPAPLILYNIPVTTHHSIPLPVVEELMRHPRVAGIKDSERDEKRQAEGIAMLRASPARSFFCGTSPLFLSTLVQGADGLVPATANFAPGVHAELYRAVQRKDQAAAETCQRLQERLTGLYLKTDRPLAQNIAALKGLMWAAGLCGPTVLSPLRTLNQQELDALKAEYQDVLSSTKGSCRVS
jgi:4-hydroxy-tetrahydrodipicolinate synthase